MKLHSGILLLVIILFSSIQLSYAQVGAETGHHYDIWTVNRDNSNHHATLRLQARDWAWNIHNHEDNNDMYFSVSKTTNKRDWGYNVIRIEESSGHMYLVRGGLALDKSHIWMRNHDIYELLNLRINNGGWIRNHNMQGNGTLNIDFGEIDFHSANIEMIGGYLYERNGDLRLNDNVRVNQNLNVDKDIHVAGKIYDASGGQVTVIDDRVSLYNNASNGIDVMTDKVQFSGLDTYLNQKLFVDGRVTFKDHIYGNDGVSGKRLHLIDNEGIEITKGDFIVKESGRSTVINSGTIKLLGNISSGDDEPLSFNDSDGILITEGELLVSTKINTKDINVVPNRVVWPDYVFESQYDLESLDAVEKFINKNGHLPNVPSSEEVNESGYNMTEMDATLLEKIEELTLYMIELKKENESLKKEIEKLKK